MTTYFTADWHLGHERIVSLCARPFVSLDAMHRVIIDNVNDVVGRGGTLIVLGDAVMGPFEETLKLLRRIRVAELILVPGNHDRVHPAYKHKGDVKAKITHYLDLYRTVFDEVLWDDGELTIDLSGTRFAMSHFPYSGDSQDEDRYREHRPFNDGLPLVHGHVHTKWHTRGPQFNAGVDVNGFMPVSEGDLINWNWDRKASLSAAR